MRGIYTLQDLRNNSLQCVGYIWIKWTQAGTGEKALTQGEEEKREPNKKKRKGKSTIQHFNKKPILYSSTNVIIYVGIKTKSS